MTPHHRPLTPAMRAALRAARSQPLRRVHKPGNGRPPWPASPNTLYALFRHELLGGSCRLSRCGNRVEEWEITDAGEEALEPVTTTPGDLPRTLYLAAEPHRLKQDYTSDPRKRMLREPDATVWRAA